MRIGLCPGVGSLRRACRLLGRAAALLAALSLASAHAAAASADPPACRIVRLADVGWTAETATTAAFARIVSQLGYQPEITVLSVPVTLEAMKNRDIDVFLGNWMPAQSAMVDPYLKDGTVEVVRPNLVGAKYTLAVPDYLYEAGLRDFADIARFRKELGASIYGIEPGNDGNAHVLHMIEKNEFGLGGFKLVESSEQGMLAHVERAVRAKQAVVFLAWAPHPMNTHYNVRYLTGGDATFGPDFGAAVVNTIVRRGYLEECPNIARLLANLEFDVELENVWMDRILSDKVSAADLAHEWVAGNPPQLAGWLEGVQSFDGQPALARLAGPAKASRLTAFEDWVTSHKIPVGDAATTVVEYTKRHARGFFDGVAAVLTGATNLVFRVLHGVTAPVLIVIFASQ
jgi:glycine betaine/proline transport system substrate-binding protein